MNNLNKLFESLTVSLQLEFEPSLEWDERRRGMVAEFVRFCMKELELNSANMPYIAIMGEKRNDMTTGGYIPSQNVIRSLGKDRHPVDVCRSLAHELVHHWQYETGIIKPGQEIQDVGGPEENEANAKAGEIVKKFTYSKGKEIYDY